MPPPPPPPSPIEALRARLANRRPRGAGAVGRRAQGLEVAYVPNWGGFVNASFRVTDRSRAVRVKLAHDPESLGGLRRWREVATLLHERHLAPRMLGWIDVPETPYEGPVFEWIDGAVPAARDSRLVADVSDALRRLHVDRDLASRLASRDEPRTCRDGFRDGLRREFVEDLRAVGAARPPFVAAGDLEWMRDEAARIAADVAVERAFDEPAAVPCHGDLWLDNLVRGADGRLAILDWDGLALGDPALDWALFLGPSRADLRPARASDLPADLATDGTFRARFDLYARASLFDWALDGLADWIEAGVLGDGAEEVRRAKERVSLAAMAAYRAAYPASTPEFGEHLAGRDYRARPGCYAVVLDARGRVAVMSTRKGFFLPGGGCEPGESAAATLSREVLEECGRSVEIVRALGRAVERVHADGEGSFAKDCAFFEARLGDVVGPSTEPDHRLVWLPAPEARERLSHRSQAWAVALLAP